MTTPKKLEGSRESYPLKGSKVSAEAIEVYAQKHSDFRFEMQVLRTLRGRGLGCEHGGTYQDPNSNRAREFDIRAWLLSGCQVAFSVECKNLSEGYPLVVHSIPRPSEDAFHEVIIPHNTIVGPPHHTVRHSWLKGRSVKVSAGQSVYRAHEHVGKSMDQVGYHKDGGEVEGRDSEVFQKFSQAINSAADLIKRAASNDYLPTTAIVPVLVVPDDRLWEIRCDSDGKVEERPRKTHRIPYLIRHTWEIELARNERAIYTMSHMELVTLSGLTEMITKLTSDSPNIFL